MNRFDMMGKDALSKVEEIMNATKLNEFLHRKEEEEKKKNCILWILAIIGVVAAVAAIALGCSWHGSEASTNNCAVLLHSYLGCLRGMVAQKMQR